MIDSSIDREGAIADQPQGEIDSELTEFVFEDARLVTGIWIDGYADSPDNDEPEWKNHPAAYHNALACGHFSHRKDGSDDYAQCAPDWIPATGIVELKRKIDAFIRGEIGGFGPTPTEYCPGDDMPPFQIAIRKVGDKTFVKLLDNGRYCEDHTVVQEFSETQLKELQDYFTRISKYWPPRQ